MIFLSLENNWIFWVIAPTIDVIYSYNLKNIIIPIIPIEEQYSTLEVLDRQTSDVDSLIKIKQKHIENINKQRQTLIYDYVTGRGELEV